LGTRRPGCTRQRCKRVGELTDRDGRLLCLTHAEQKADATFQGYVRRRDRGCTAIGVLTSTACLGTTQAAHIVGRGNHAVRYDPENVWGLCAAHHMLVDQTGREDAKFRWAVSRLGVAGVVRLMERAREPTTRRAAVAGALGRDWRLPGDEDVPIIGSGRGPREVAG